VSQSFRLGSPLKIEGGKKIGQSKGMTWHDYIINFAVKIAKEATSI
jgi:hypothetical protein